VKPNCLIVVNRLFVSRAISILEYLKFSDRLCAVHADSAGRNKTTGVISKDADGISRFCDLNKPRVIEAKWSFRLLTTEVDEMVFLDQHRQFPRCQMSACCIKIGCKDLMDRYAEQSAEYGNGFIRKEVLSHFLANMLDRVSVWPRTA
jgi:hypothetical protein